MVANLSYNKILFSSWIPTGMLQLIPENAELLCDNQWNSEKQSISFFI